MSDDKGKVIRFPTQAVRQRARRGPRAVSCIVSGQYLVFGEAGEEMGDGIPIHVSLMTEGAGSQHEGKPVCRANLYVTLEELSAVVAALSGGEDAAGIVRVDGAALDVPRIERIEVTYVTADQQAVIDALGARQQTTNLVSFFIEATDDSPARIEDWQLPVIRWRGRHRQIMPNGDMVEIGPPALKPVK